MSLPNCGRGFPTLDGYLIKQLFLCFSSMLVSDIFLDLPGGCFVIDTREEVTSSPHSSFLVLKVGIFLPHQFAVFFLQVLYHITRSVCRFSGKPRDGHGLVPLTSLQCPNHFYVRQDDC